MSRAALAFAVPLVAAVLLAPRANEDPFARAVASFAGD